MAATVLNATVAINNKTLVTEEAAHTFDALITFALGIALASGQSIDGPSVRLIEESSGLVLIGGGYAGGASPIVRGVAFGSLPSAGAGVNGLLIFDTTNNRLCVYVGGNRYYLTGTSF